MNGVRESPRFFLEQVLGDTLDEQQIEVVDKFKASRRLAVKSGHSCGKDWLSARLALWFHLAYYPSYVITIGPTDRQVKTVMWGEIRTAYHNSRYPIGGQLLPESSLLKSFKQVNGQTVTDPDHKLFGFVAKAGAAFQGFHKKNVLVIVTEAQGISLQTWEAVNSLMTADHAQLLAIGNPCFEPGSMFHRMFDHSDPVSTMYDQVTLDSERSSHCSREFINEIELEGGGRDSALFQIRVKGNFPDNISDSLIPPRWVEAAFERWEETPDEGDQTLGVDVARFGSDETIFYRGRGIKYDCVHQAQGQDLMQTTGQVVAKAKELGVPFENVRLDDTGIGGGVTDRLNELHSEGKIPNKICPINFGSKPAEEEKYSNARAEMFDLLKGRFRDGTIALNPRDTKLRRDLMSLKYKINSQGKIQLEDKAETKKRLKYSPDRADALALAALPQHVAKLVATGKLPNMGLMELMERQAKALKAKQENPGADRSLKGAVTTVPVSETPNAHALGVPNGQPVWHSVRTD